MNFKSKFFFVLPFFISVFLIEKALFANVFYTLPAQELSTEGQNAQVATNETGQYVYPVYSGASGIKVRASTDYGRTYSDEISIGTVNNDLPEIVTNNTGQFVTIFWSDNGIFTSNSQDFGQTFSPPRQLDTLNAAIEMTINNSGQYVYAIWKDSSSKIHTSASSDFGDRWFPFIELDSDATTGSFDIATNNSGQYVYAIWEDILDKVQVRVSSDFGDSFATAIELGERNVPLIITDSSGKFGYSSWVDSASKMQFSSSSNFGASWSSSIELATDVSTIEKNRLMAISSNGQFVHILWLDTSGNLLIRTSTDFGSSFSPAILIDTSSTNATLATDITGQYVYVVWLDSNSDIQTKLSSNFGSSFGPKTILTALPELTDTFPSVSINFAGKYVHTIWSDRSFDSVKIVSGVRLLFPKNVSFLDG